VVLELHSGTSHSRGVLCLYCGSRALLPHPSEKRRSGEDDAAQQSLVALIRCRLCGKEAPYGPQEIVDFRDAA
jgi:hypothetical protein